MSEPSKRSVANKANARLSTGPKSKASKSKSGGNALNHGILSKKLLLADENPDDGGADFQALFQCLLVERIAVSVWRQRRLVGAEAASIAEKQTVRSALALTQHADLVSRCQTALDNEWFKALRSLREIQRFRIDQAALNLKAVPA